MPDATPEAIVRVAIAVWIADGDAGVDTGDLFEMDTPDASDPAPVLGVVGQLCLVELDAANRERVLQAFVDEYQVGAPGLTDARVLGPLVRTLGIELAFFGEAGGFFASSISYLPQWPRTHADMPAEVFIDSHHRATFASQGDAIVLSVRHALRPANAPPKRWFRLRAEQYAAAISNLAREAQRLRDDVIAIAQRRAPQKVEALREAFEGGLA